MTDEQPPLVTILSAWEGEGDGSRLNYGSMGETTVLLQMRGVQVEVSLGYSSMDMEPLTLVVRDPNIDNFPHDPHLLYRQHISEDGNPGEWVDPDAMH